MNDCDSRCGKGKISVHVKIVIKFPKKRERVEIRVIIAV